MSGVGGAPGPRLPVAIFFGGGLLAPALVSLTATSWLLALNFPFCFLN